MYSSLTELPDIALDFLHDPAFLGPWVADSRHVTPGAVFLAFPGEFTDGRNFLKDAVERGAAAVLYQESPDFHPASFPIPAVSIPDLAARAGILTALHLHNYHPDSKMVGVTGTNGKTSITGWLAEVLNHLGDKTALIGTVGNGFLNHLEATTYTTPDAVTLQHLIARYRHQGATAFALEVSSHALAQDRVNGVAFDTAVFTNLTRDHLDYHGTMENYYAAKRKLFYWRNLRHAVINSDDPYGARLAAELKKDLPHLHITTYGFNQDAALRITKCVGSAEGMMLRVAQGEEEWEFETSLIGRFNALNLAATLAVLWGFKERGGKFALSTRSVTDVMGKLKPAPGRMQALRTLHRPLVIVDYAHTPDALKNTLMALAELKEPGAKVWCVFGCGGNRDHGKRPLMGEIAAKYADASVVTSDNPRDEDPEAIINEILPVANAVLIEPDRGQAIRYAITHAGERDIILLAGKGHETYQEIKGVKHHFDDSEIAREALRIR